MHPTADTPAFIHIKRAERRVMPGVMLFPLVSLMKKTTAALTFIVFCIVLTHGQVSVVPDKQPAEWSLSLKTGGAPWEKRFEVELNQSGNLTVTEQDPGKTPNDPVTKLKADLSTKDAQEIYEQTLKALLGFRFPDKDAKIQDGTTLTLNLSANGRGLMAVYHVGMTEEEIPEVARVLALINKHLPKEHQVY
jgi:hypothetical protein